MANTCTIDIRSSGGTITRRYSDDSVTERFLVKLDVATRDLISVLNSARAANPTQFPLKGQSWPSNPTYGLYADSFQLEPRNEFQTQWFVTVTYTPLKAGEHNTEGSGNPLLWPAVFAVDWIEYDEAVTKARNVEAFTAAGAFNRPALTLGPCTNSAGGEFEEGVFETTRDAVLSITKNVATLNEVLSLEGTYAKTTNSDTVYGVGPRRYKYIGVETSGIQTANGISYYARTVRVQVMKTTDRAINNVGWHNINFDGKKVKYKVRKQDESGAAIEPAVYEDAQEPGFLTLAGARSEAATTVSYRWLTEVPYAGLLI
jgi:hypothetical protein